MAGWLGGHTYGGDMAGWLGGRPCWGAGVRGWLARCCLLSRGVWIGGCCELVGWLAGWVGGWLGGRVRTQAD